MRYRAVLFDLDGTLLDTNELIMASFLHTLDIHCPGKYKREDVLAIMGQPLITQMRLLDAEQAEAMVETYTRHNLATHDEHVTAFPHVLETVPRLKDIGMKLAIVTNKRRPVVEMGLKLFGLESYFDMVVCVGDVQKPKPDPEMVNMACEQLGVTAEESLMVGDSKYDIMAATNAQVDSAGVEWSLHTDELKEQQPTYMLKELHELISIVQGA